MNDTGVKPGHDWDSTPGTVNAEGTKFWKDHASTQPLSTADPRSVDIIESWKTRHRELAAIIPNLQFVERTSTRLAVEALVEKVRKLNG